MVYFEKLKSKNEGYCFNIKKHYQHIHKWERTLTQLCKICRVEVKQTEHLQLFHLHLQPLDFSLF